MCGHLVWMVLASYSFIAIYVFLHYIQIVLFIWIALKISLSDCANKMLVSVKSYK